MNYCKICGQPAPQEHDLCWMCEHDPKLTMPDDASHCTDDACPLEVEKQDE